MMDVLSAPTSGGHLATAHPADLSGGVTGSVLGGALHGGVCQVQGRHLGDRRRDRSGRGLSSVPGPGPEGRGLARKPRPRLSLEEGARADVWGERPPTRARGNPFREGWTGPGREPSTGRTEARSPPRSRARRGPSGRTGTRRPADTGRRRASRRRSLRPRQSARLRRPRRHRRRHLLRFGNCLSFYISYCHFQI